MTVKPSDVAGPRDDSTTGMLRRWGMWMSLLAGAYVTLILGTQLAAIFLGAAPPAWGLRGALSALLDTAREATRSSGSATRELIATLLGLGIAGWLAWAAGAVIWSWLLRVTGLREADQRQQDQLDGARWARREDLAAVLVRRGEHANRLVLGSPRQLRVSRDRLVAVESGHSALIVAPTGQGKTESLMVPAILDWDGPVLVCSIKRDVYDLTAGYRGQVGETRVLDPAGLTDPTQTRTAYWTPLAEARSWRAARMLADQMAGVGRQGAQATGNEDYFSKASGELLAGLFFAASHSPVPTMRTVGDWLADPEDAIPTIEQLLTGMSEDEGLPDDVRLNAPHALRSIQLRMIGKDPRTVEPIRASAANIIRAWDDYRLADVSPDDPGVLSPEWLWSDPDEWEQPGDQRTLYVVCPDAEQGTYEGMIVGAITQAYNAYGRAGQSGRTPPKRLLIVLDEVANTCPVPKLDTWVTAARGLGINLVIACQNLAQLDTVWGPQKAETIASGPRVRMFGPGLADDQTLSYIERIGGQTGVVLETESRNPYFFQLPTSRQTQTQRIALVQRPTAQQVPPFSGLVFYGSLPPFAVNWRSAHNDRELRDKQQHDPLPPGPAEIEHLSTPRHERPLLVPGELALAVAAVNAPDVDVDEGLDDAMPEDWSPGEWIADDDQAEDPLGDGDGTGGPDPEPDF